MSISSFPRMLTWFTRRKGLEFSSFWQGPVDGLVYGCLASFPYFGARLRLYAYDDNLNIPPGIEVADAREICADKKLLDRYFADGQVEPSKFSNLFRYLLMQKMETCWVDCDLLCLRPADFCNDAFVFGRTTPEMNHEWGINGAVLKLPSDSLVLARLIRHARTAADLDQPWGVIGPLLITRLFNESGLSELARPMSDFYPLDSARFWMPLLPEAARNVEAAVSSSRMLHLWHNNFKRCGYDKQAAPPEGSFLHDAFTRVGGLGGFSRTYGAEELKHKISEWLPEEIRPHVRMP